MPGLATGPAIYASEEHSELHQLMRRNFIEEGDVELVRPFPPWWNWYLIFHAGYRLRSPVLWYRTNAITCPVLRRQSTRCSALAAGQRY